ncbi:MAG: ATP-binding protein [Pseudohongiellaceae bacterium]
MASGSRKPSYSLQSRLLLAFSVLLFFFLGLTGIILDRAFRTSVEAGAAERLQVQIYLLLATAEEDNGEFYFLQELQESRFSQLNSGLYGFISSSAYGIVWRSDSARTFSVPDDSFFQQRVEVGETLFLPLQDAEGESYFALSYGILWEDGISEYSFSVIENAAPYYSEIINFRASLWYWLGGVAVVLLLIQFLLLRWGLLPLHRIANDLKKMESGSHDKLEGAYPRELQGVTDNLNLLIESERKQQSRYRTTLGDLAHSLKTPLAVIGGLLPRGRGAGSGPGLALSREQLDAVLEQLERMNQIVSYQLQRAVKTRETTSLARHVNASQSVRRVLDALRKVYADKGISVETDLDEQALFFGDERDLLEVLGNVLDNAFKYGRSRIRITLGKVPPTVRGICLVVEDDGAGIPAEKHDFVLQRGARADTLMQGQGIGLAVVTDIVGSYGGEIRVEDSELGGARIVIQLNSAERIQD